MSTPLHLFYRHLPAAVRGMILVTASALAFSAMHAVIRYLTTELHPFEIAFFRNFFGLLALTPVFWRHGRAILKTTSLPLHALRGLLQICAMLLFFTALERVPLAKVSALSFAAPLFATVGAVLVLREPIHLRRMVALVAGFLGAMVVLQPGRVEMDPGAFMVLGSSSFWAVALLVIKVLARRDSSLTIATYMGLFMTPLSLGPTLLVWTWPAPIELFWLAVMGVLGTLGHILMAQGLAEADATVVLPLDFTRLIWASALGFVLFSEVPQASTWVGGIIIFASATYITYREARAKDGGSDAVQTSPRPADS